MSEWPKFRDMEGRHLFKTTEERDHILGIVNQGGILGLDISTDTAGVFFAPAAFAKIDVPRPTDYYVTTIDMPGEKAPERFDWLTRAMPWMIQIFCPEAAAVEETYVGPNMKISLELTWVVGYVVGRLKEYGARVVTAKAVTGKRCLTGRTNVSKKAMEEAMAHRLGFIGEHDFDEHQAHAFGQWLHLVTEVMWAEEMEARSNGTHDFSR